MSELFKELRSVFGGDNDTPLPPQGKAPAGPRAPAVVPAKAALTKMNFGSDSAPWSTNGRERKPRQFSVPTRFENRHFLLTGTTGAGKSFAFYQLFDQIQARGDKAIIVDHGGENIKRYYRPGDVVLNPFDARFPGWSPFNEIRDEYDHDNMARFVVPDGHGDSGQWNHYAQTLYASISRLCEVEGQTTVRALLYQLLSADGQALGEKLMAAGEPAAALFSKGSEKMAANARSILGTQITAWRYMTEGGSFSIRDWVENDNDRRWVFISYKESNFGALKGFISMVVSIAINYALDLPEDENRRIWFSLDEFASLPKMSSVMDALTKIRKKGGCVIAGLQSFSQAVESYGKEGATTLFSNFNTWIALRPGHAETAEVFSKHFGEQEVWKEDFSDNAGIGGGGANSGESISKKLHVERVETYTELMLLDDLCAVVKFPGNIDVAYTRIPPIVRPQVAEPFIPKPKKTA